jgi:hypothetical protein
MGRIPRRPRLCVARGMDKGNCSLFARFARFSSDRGRISIHFETSSPPLRSGYPIQVTFRSPRSIQFSSTKPAAQTEALPSNRRISIHRQTTCKSFASFADILQNVARWRSTTRRPTIGLTMGIRLSPTHDDSIIAAAELAAQAPGGCHRAGQVRLSHAAVLSLRLASSQNLNTGRKCH